jgi:pimeloyl-ACP methyl ester carboxylesterase
MRRAILVCFSIFLSSLSYTQAAEPATREPYGIALEGFAYPYPVHLLPLVNDGEQVRMAYMDIASAQPNGRTVVLLHGRNFPSSYWAPVIKTLNDAGYRVVVPDQIGFGKSSKPQGDLHFDTLARNTIALLDHLGVAKADIVAHSLGGMLGVRIARAYPDRIAHLVLTAPIGLEDYRLYVPPTPTEKILENEDKLTADGYRKQLETNYALKLPPEQVTPFIDARFNIKGSAEYQRWLRAFVSSAQMIYREPVVHEIPLITQPTLLRDGRRRSQRAGQSQCAGGAARENGAERRVGQGARGQDGERPGRGGGEYRPSGISGSAGQVQRTRARISGRSPITDHDIHVPFSRS